jgi:predicted nucleic acid-binding protein
MKQKIYIETTVVSYFVSKPSKNIITASHQVITRDFWDIINNFDIYISDLVLQEAAAGDKIQAQKRLNALAGISLLEIDDDTKKLAKSLLEGKAIPTKYPEDAFHIAVATLNGIDIIVTWNFKHINNPFTRKTIRRVIEKNGFVCPEICSPDEFMGDDSWKIQ